MKEDHYQCFKIKLNKMIINELIYSRDEAINVEFESHIYNNIRNSLLNILRENIYTIHDITIAAVFDGIHLGYPKDTPEGDIELVLQVVEIKMDKNNKPLTYSDMDILTHELWYQVLECKLEEVNLIAYANANVLKNIEMSIAYFEKNK